MNRKTQPRRVRSIRALIVFTLCAGVCLLNAGRLSADSAHDELARKILADTGVTGGLIVHLGAGDGQLTAALKTGQVGLVHGLDANADKVQQARQFIRAQGLYGDVSVDRLQGPRLPYVDNLVNLLVAEDLGDVPMPEVLRVLAPNGVAYINQDGVWTKTVKPRPQNIDEWTHYMHDATGNAVAHDTEVGPPKHLQWLGSPRWSRHHDRMASMSALVSAGGRVFYIMDEGSRVSIQLPPKWTLVARDAFNGTILWKQPIRTWHSHLWPLKSGPTQLARRLVADGKRVYVTLGLEAPLTAIDAATGRIVRTFSDTRSTEEVIHSEGTLFLLVNKGQSELSNFLPQNNVGDQRRVAGEFRWNELPRTIMAIDAETGRTLWSKQSRVAPITLAAAGKRVFFHDGDKVVCLDRTTGEELWTADAPRRQNVTMNFGPKVVIYKDVVLFAGGERTMRAFAIEDGKQLWTAPHGRSGYQSPEDLLVAGGLVWSTETTRTTDSGVYTGRDPKTGEVKIEFPPNINTYWFHHRCYMGKATDRFLMPSRTGIEFVDYDQKNWDINHWVRGGCLYGVMPCNGMVYAPPHNCACYPEAKLYGFNVLTAAAPTREVPRDVPDAGRLEKGPAYGAPIIEVPLIGDWPTYRHDAKRSGFTELPLSSDLAESWQTDLGGRLSSVTIAGGKLYVAQIDAHTVHALDAESGQTLWSYTTGGRVDSPPTVDGGRVLFGSADGWVYSLRASDGALAWRFRAAPEDRRTSVFEQLESLWPVHGSVLVRDGIVYFVAGRSNFLDGGLRWIKLDAESGRKLAEVVIDDRDPESGTNLQERLQVLNMPVGLPDVLSSDDRFVYMRSQRFDFDGKRQDLGPHSGQPAQQGAVQSGEGAHLFAPMGFLDDTWFHRSYWVYGRSFAGGHAGYYQAGKYTPSGRILVFDDESVYGYGRKPQYLRWTTTMEHQLFAADKAAPEIDPQLIRRGGGVSLVRFKNTDVLDPTGRPLAVEAWIYAERPQGVVLARGGPSNGYALVIRGGQPRFVIRSAEEISSVSANQNVVGRWVHLAGVLTADKKLQIFVDGKLAGQAEASDFIAAKPVQTTQIGADEGGSVGSYSSPLAFSGTIDEVRVYHGTITAEEIQARFTEPGQTAAKDATLVLACSFDKGDAADLSGNKNHGTVELAQAVKGRIGDGLKFVGRPGRGGGSNVEHRWTKDVPLFVRAMLLAEGTLFIAGPPDIVDEEESFRLLVGGDEAVQQRLAEQAAALQGRQGGLLQAVSSVDGEKLAEYRLDSLPVWDGMAAARGRLYLATTNGKVICFSGP